MGMESVLRKKSIEAHIVIDVMTGIHFTIICETSLFYNCEFVPVNPLHLFCPSSHFYPQWQPPVFSLYL